MRHTLSPDEKTKPAPSAATRYQLEKMSEAPKLKNATLDDPNEEEKQDYDVLTQPEIVERFIDVLKSKGKMYKKYNNIDARPAAAGENIVTVTASGEVETENFAELGDVVVRNQTGAQEEYILTSAKFEARYKLANTKKADDGGYREYVPIGDAIGVEMTLDLMRYLGWGEKGTFIAAWGHLMLVRRGDYLVCPPEMNEIYRIAKVEFSETYELSNQHGICLA